MWQRMPHVMIAKVAEALALRKGFPYDPERREVIGADIYTADECFLTGSAAEVIPVVSIDSRPIGDGKVGPTTKQLMIEFKKLVVR
jgi:branched-chain amino acid aminotransferase